MSYSQGIGQFADMFLPPDAVSTAAQFLAPLAPAGCSVLDIGAGTGRTAFALATTGCHVTALEPDPEMFAILLARLAQRPDLHANLSPVPQSAGFRLGRMFDMATCFSVLHLLQQEERGALVAYAARQVRSGGLVVLDVPAASNARRSTPMQRIATRRLGDTVVEHYSAQEPGVDGWWYTHWQFRILLGSDILKEVQRCFHWYPFPIRDIEHLVMSAGLEVIAEYGGHDGAPFIPGVSRTQLLVARAT